jgi:hypothetical protein
VLYGHAVTLSGRISSGERGQQIVILARQYGQAAPTEGATVTTGAGGRWSFRVAPSTQTSYSVRWGGAKTRAITVGVEPRVTVVLLGNGLIAAHVAADRPLTGRVVELQKFMSAKRWSTILRMPLDRRATAIFPPISNAAATLRIAMSVNQAGAGLLGARSHAFVDHNV